MNVPYTQQQFHQSIKNFTEKVLMPLKQNSLDTQNYQLHNEKMQKLIRTLFYASKIQFTNKLKFTEEVLTFLEQLEPLIYNQFPENVTSIQFYWIVYSMYFDAKYIDKIVYNNARLFHKIVEKIRDNYNVMLNSKNFENSLTKMCQVISEVDKPKEQALLKAIAVQSIENLPNMSNQEIINTCHTIFPFIVREQIALFNRQRIHMQNKSAHRSSPFMKTVQESKEQGVYLKICQEISNRFEQNNISMEDFFELSIFTNKANYMTEFSTYFRLMKQYDPHVMKFVLDIIPKLNENGLSRLLFYYAYNSWESQERFTYQENFHKELAQKVVERALSLTNISNESFCNISKSFGSLVYSDENVEKFMLAFKTQTFSKPDIQNITNISQACINLKIYDKIFNKEEQSKLAQLYLKNLEIAKLPIERKLILTLDYVRKEANNEIYNPLLFDQLFKMLHEQINKQINDPNSNSSQSMQLTKTIRAKVYQIYIFLKYERPQLIPVWLNKNKQIINDYEKEFKYRTQKVVYNHNLHSKVTNFLKQNGIEYKQEYFDEFFVDYFLPKSNTIIEVNGPQHYIAPSRELSQTTEAKLRLLRKKGYNLIEIPFFINERNHQSNQLSEDVSSPRIEDLLEQLKENSNSQFA
eukprot:403365837